MATIRKAVKFLFQRLKVVKDSLGNPKWLWIRCGSHAITETIAEHTTEVGLDSTSTMGTLRQALEACSRTLPSWSCCSSRKHSESIGLGKHVPWSCQTMNNACMCGVATKLLVVLQSLEILRYAYMQKVHMFLNVNGRKGYCAWYDSSHSIQISCAAMLYS